MYVESTLVYSLEKRALPQLEVSTGYRLCWKKKKTWTLNCENTLIELDGLIKIIDRVLSHYPVWNHMHYVWMCTQFDIPSSHWATRVSHKSHNALKCFLEVMWNVKKQLCGGSSALWQEKKCLSTHTAFPYIATANLLYLVWFRSFQRSLLS